jgi:hypothetical protein
VIYSVRATLGRQSLSYTKPALTTLQRHTPSTPAALRHPGTWGQTAMSGAAGVATLVVGSVLVDAARSSGSLMMSATLPLWFAVPGAVAGGVVQKSTRSAAAGIGAGAVAGAAVMAVLGTRHLSSLLGGAAIGAASAGINHLLKR